VQEQEQEQEQVQPQAKSVQVPTVSNRTLRRVRFANEEGQQLTLPKYFAKNSQIIEPKKNQTKRKLRSNLFA
jgi:hypothetical protein